MYLAAESELKSALAGCRLNEFLKVERAHNMKEL